MKTVFVLLVGCIGLVCAQVWARERWDLLSEQVSMRAGDAAHAYALCRSIESRNLWFLDKRDIVNQCEGAATEALASALRADLYEPAVAYCAAVLAPPDTGYEDTVRPTCRGLGMAHVAYVTRLVARGDEEAVLAQVKTGEDLFGAQPGVVSRLRGLRAEAQALEFERLVAAGDAEAAFDALAVFESTAPAAVLRNVEGRVNDAWTFGVAKHIGGHNFPAVLEFHNRWRARLRPELRYRLAIAYRETMQKLFWLPSSEDIRDVLDENEEPPVVAVDQTRIPRRAVVTFVNQTSRPMWVVLRGELRDYRLRAIAPGAARAESIRPGRYAEVVHTGTGVHPFIGVIQVPEVDATQAFSIDDDRSMQSATWTD